jgi:hypothetical protein
VSVDLEGRGDDAGVHALSDERLEKRMRGKNGGMNREERIFKDFTWGDCVRAN